VILIVSLVIAQNISKLVPKATPTPAPTKISPTPSQTSTPTPAPTPSLYPGEVTQYQGQNLTSIAGFLKELALHPDVAIDGTLNLNQATYRLTVNGIVNQTLTYTYDDAINNFTSYQQVSPLLCVEGWSVTMLWQGIRLSDLLQKAGANPNASTLIFSAPDGYSTSLPMDYVLQNNIILAYKVNNVTLPAAMGWPFMVIAQNQYGYKWIKWVDVVNVSNDSSFLGYWESQGYPNNATIISG
jgi:DMSO/TMAO reductase YedYZ molybdopterin-dependent catalytic subunit